MRRLVALLLLLLAAGRADAQNVRGTVRDSTRGLPIPGTVVLTLDSARVVLARTITNARGEYELPRAPEARIVRTLRLGFRPVERPIPASAGETVRVDINIIPVPVTLEAVKTIAAAHCPKRRDAPQALSLLEQVRTGLLATVVARESRPALLTRLDIVRTRHFETDSIITMSVTMDSARSTNSYAAALPATDFIQMGFARDSLGIMTAYGPDAEVLMDEAFANGYCFRVMDAVASRPKQIGLGFAAAGSQRGRVDIDGALWVDTAAKALVDIEFAYRGFDRVFDRGRPGGHIEFRVMPNGVTIIDRWFLRLPSKEARDSVNGRPRTMVGFRTADVVMHETGGELARAKWDDGTSWRASLGSVRIHLADRRGKADTARAVRLDSTSYAGRSDSNGDVQIDELTPGPYTPVLLDGRLIQIGVKIPTGITFWALRDTTLSVNVTTMTPEEFTLATCATDRTGTGRTMIYGRILEEDGTPANRVELAIERLTEGKLVERVAEGGHTGSNGLFRWCALERGWHLIIRASRGDIKRTVEIPNLPEGLTVVQFKLVPNQ